jgi:hypothetical protein
MACPSLNLLNNITNAWYGWLGGFSYTAQVQISVKKLKPKPEVYQDAYFLSAPAE